MLLGFESTALTSFGVPGALAASLGVLGASGTAFSLATIVTLLWRDALTD